MKETTQVHYRVGWQVHYRVGWDIPAEDPVAQLRGTNHVERIFDGEDGERRGLEHIALLRESEARGMCSHITIETRTVTVTAGEWESADPRIGEGGR